MSYFVYVKYENEEPNFIPLIDGMPLSQARKIAKELRRDPSTTYIEVYSPKTGKRYLYKGYKEGLYYDDFCY